MGLGLARLGLTVVLITHQLDILDSWRLMIFSHQLGSLRSNRRVEVGASLYGCRMQTNILQPYMDQPVMLCPPSSSQASRGLIFEIMKASNSARESISLFSHEVGRRSWVSIDGINIHGESRAVGVENASLKIAA